VQIDDDLTSWDFWWEFNKDPFIRLKDAVQSGGPQTGSDDFYLGGTRRNDAKDSLKPTEEQIKNEILPALKKAIDSTEQRDITSSCMVAMAKIGINHPPEFNLIDVFTPRLKKPDQEIRETAALSIGIAAIAEEKEMPMLIGLALDDESGKAAAGGSVDDRTRSFATYGLGLMAYHHTKVELKAAAFDPMKKLVNDKKMSNRNIKVAAINAIGLLNIGGSSDAERALMDEALKCLEDYYKEPLGAGEQLIQAHCPTAIAKLIGRDHPKSDYYKELFHDEMLEKPIAKGVKRSNDTIYQSCALALGQLARPYTDKDEKKCPDAKYSKLLLDQWHKHKDAQTRNFSVLSLGFIGGSENLKALLEELRTGQKNQQKPWCALSLGVYSFFVLDQRKKGNAAAQAEDLSLVNEALFTSLKATTEPSLTGALAISLGLSQTIEAADVMRERMRENPAKEQMAGYLAIGLALMNDGRSLADIRNLVDQSIRRTDLLQQCAIALGKLGDKSVAEQLLKHLTEGEPNLAKLSAVASALGFIGDARTVSPLKKMLFDEKLGDLSRAFAAVALGGVADKEPLPWNSKIGTNMNYRASVETLTNRNTGILDIL